MNVALLADHPEVIPVLAGWYQSEWEPYYGVDGPGDARRDLESRCNYDVLPVGLVALQDGEVRGTVALGLDLATNLTPSVIGLLVGREHRGRGIATALLESAKSLARRLGYSRVHVSTTVLHDLLVREGWRRVGEIKFLNDEQGSIYVCELEDLPQ